jgi:hypothetical protein
MKRISQFNFDNSKMKLTLLKKLKQGFKAEKVNKFSFIYAKNYKKVE